MTTLIWAAVVGALLANLRYWQLLRKFRSDNYVMPKSYNTYKYLLSTHFKGQTREGKKFVYCPVERIVSWSSGDHDHEWCHACQMFFSQKVESLLDPSEREQRRAQ